MKKVLNRLKILIKHSPIESLLWLVAVVLLVSTVLNNLTVFSNFKNIRKTNATVKLEIIQDDGQTTYENIITNTFKFYDIDTGEPVPMASGEIKLEDVIITVNKYLETSKYKVCNIGIFGDTLYIQQDTRYEVDGLLKLNIVSIKENMDLVNWLKLTETMYNDNVIHTASLITYQTEIGNRHYMYVYETEIPDDSTIVKPSEQETSKINNTENKDKQ